MYYAYIFEGSITRRDRYGFTDSTASGIKIGQTQDWKKRRDQLRYNGNIHQRAIFYCYTREDAELLESGLRRYYLKQKNAKRNGNDWVENIEFDADTLIMDPDLEQILKIVGCKKVKIFNYPTVLPSITFEFN